MALSSQTRSFVADTLALVIFFTIASGLNERFVAGMAWSEVAVTRSFGAVLMVMTARPYGMWRDWIFRTSDPQTAWTSLLTDCLSLLLFQVPIYCVILMVGGAEGTAILKGAAGFSIAMLVLGRPYGLFLDLVRRSFGLSGGGQKPMSLGG
jgi:hypothetical protein